MTFKELKAKLLTCEKAIKCLQNGTYKDLSPDDISDRRKKLNTIRENILKEMKVIKEAVEFDNEKDAADFADKNPETPVKIVKESFSIEETKAIAKKVGKAVAMALKSVGDAITSMKAIRVEENSFEIKVLYKNGSSDEFSFYISKDKLHLVDFSFDKELIDVGVKPSGEPIVHVDVLSNALINHFKETLAEEYAADKYNVNVFGYQTKYYKICPGAKSFMEKVVSGDYGDVNKDEAIRLAKLHDILFLYEIKALKDSEYAAGILDSAVNIVDVIKDQVQSMGMPIADVDYLDSHIEKIKDAAEGVEETKGAPKGHYFTKSGNLVKGRLTQAAREKGARLSDPKDKQRSKVPPVTQYNEGEGDDHHYIKVSRADFKKAEAIILQNIQNNNVGPKMDLVDNDGAGNVIIYFMFRDGDIASGEANSFMHDTVMDLEAYGIMIPDHSAEMDEAELTKGEKKKLKDMSKSLKKSSKGHAGQAKYIDKLVKEGRGDMDILLSLIKDRATESGFSEAEEAEEVIDAIRDHFKLDMYGKIQEADLVSITDGQYAYIKGIIDILKSGEMPQDIGYRKEAIKALLSLLRNPNDVKELWHGDHDDDDKLQEGTDLYDKKGLHFKRFAGKGGPALQITVPGMTTMSPNFIQIPGSRLGEFASALMQAIRVFDDMSRQTPVDEAMGDDVPDSMKGSVSKLQQVHSMIVNKMKSFAKMYKEKGGDHIFKSYSGEENKVIDILKDLNDKKKKVEDALDKKVSGIGRNQQLAETPEQEEAVYELRNIVDQVEELGDQARQIVRQNFPNEMSRMEGYGVFNLAYSNNRYDTTLGSEVDRLEGGDYDDLDDDNYPMEAMSNQEREDKLQQAKRGGGKEKPLRKLAAMGKKEEENA
tara:strand:+ start:1553 stop:4186 length:2634 start_codon:yes stop_codon:yes gene_type:complete